MGKACSSRQLDLQFCRGHGAHRSAAPSKRRGLVWGGEPNQSKPDPQSAKAHFAKGKNVKNGGGNGGKKGKFEGRCFYCDVMAHTKLVEDKKREKPKSNNAFGGYASASSDGHVPASSAAHGAHGTPRHSRRRRLWIRMPGFSTRVMSCTRTGFCSLIIKSSRRRCLLME